MNLLQAKARISQIIDSAVESGYNPADVTISIQIGNSHGMSVWSDEVSAEFDSDGNVSGCVFYGMRNSDAG